MQRVEPTSSLNEQLASSDIARTRHPKERISPLCRYADPFSLSNKELPTRNLTDGWPPSGSPKEYPFSFPPSFAAVASIRCLRGW